MPKRLPGEWGFTLVELLVVVAIIALLAGVAAPKLYAAAVSSRESRVAEDLQAIEAALERHYLEHLFYPAKLHDLVERGCLPPTNFRSPASGYWYFYVVDDNREDGLAQAYALGAPPRNAESDDKRRLHRAGPIPQGRNPKSTARAWLRWRSYESGYDLLYVDLYKENDYHHLPDDENPTSLSDYRFSCRSSSTSRCDLVTN